MSMNPIINALGAVGYIGLVVGVINLMSATHGDQPDTAFAPVIFLSLLTLSVTVMVILFFYQPFQLFIEGKKKQAVKLFSLTVGAFAIITVVVLGLFFSGITR